MSLERTDEETRPTNNAIGVGVIGNQEIKLNERNTPTLFEITTNLRSTVISVYYLQVIARSNGSEYVSAVLLFMSLSETPDAMCGFTGNHLVRTLLRQREIRSVAHNISDQSKRSLLNLR